MSIQENNILTALTPQDNMPLWSTMGMELTWLHYQSLHESLWVTGYSSFLYARMKEAAFPFEDCHPDEGALEVNTPAFLSISEAIVWYRAFLKFIDAYPLVTNREDSASGGGHIHVAIPNRILKDETKLLVYTANLFRDVTGRPYLNWIFNDWGNIQSAKNHVEFRKQDLRWGNRSEFMNLIFDDDPKIPAEWIEKKRVFDELCRHTYKGYGLNLSCEYEGGRSGKSKPKTYEFRFFDTVRNEQDIRLHLQFTDRYLKYVERLTDKGEIVKNTIKKVGDIRKFATDDYGLKQFQSLMEELGLNYGDYQHFVERNYYRRKTEGLLR